ncbi:hypothetical protein NX773_18615 [Massilia solisilvae]|uniref:Uncharacterized protein n=1 Tax=Massilia solisilvae TaxID=1811225 RepID=A0ABT2BNW4_9BURK|nr:hypothetical protein [Massilia solisilvae]MCS0610184.1 hypothetical protein [Massilia solisilvae]
MDGYGGREGRARRGAAASAGQAGASAAAAIIDPNARLLILLLLDMLVSK